MSWTMSEMEARETSSQITGSETAKTDSIKLKCLHLDPKPKTLVPEALLHSNNFRRLISKYYAVVSVSNSTSYESFGKPSVKLQTRSFKMSPRRSVFELK